MINNRYKLYVQDTLALARTVVLKSSAAATALNDYLKMLYPGQLIDQGDKASWKYYKNISGQPHSTDTPMVVTSLDDLTVVPFTQAGLVTHPQTRAAYQYGTRYYEDLLVRYPDQEMLILGVLYAPTRAGYIQEVIAAPDATVLYYPPQYIESWELDLPAQIQQWAYDYYSTWVNVGYTLSDDLYCATVLAQMTLHLVPALINMRLAACRTPQVHSYHIKEYLASNAGLDRYYDQLTREQRLFLYRNLPYIRNNAGRKEVFDWLIENLLTKRNLPLYEYVVKHNTYVQLPDAEFPNRLSYTPGLNVQRKALNYDDNNQLTALKSFENIREQMDTSAPGNEKERVYVTPNEAQAFQTHSSSVIATKLVESIALDMSDMVPHPLPQVLFSHWMSWAASGQYTASIPLEINGKINVKTLSVKDCVVLYQYCMAMSRGQVPDVIRPIVVERVLRVPKPTSTDIDITAWASQLTTAQKALLASYVPTVPHLYTVDDFYNSAYASYLCGVLQYRYTGTIRDINKNMAAQSVSTRYYTDAVHTLYTNKTYAAWLQETDIELQNYEQQDYLNLATQIFDQATGMSAHAQISIKEVQRAMLAVLSTLTSYSVQYLSDVDSSKVKLIHNPVLLLSDPPKLSTHQEYSELPNQDIQAIRTNVAQYHGDMTLKRNAQHSSVQLSHRVQGVFANPHLAQSVHATPERTYAPTPIMTAMSTDDAMAAWNALTPSQKLLVSTIS